MAKSNEAHIHADPKLHERVTWQRVKLVVEHEACHSDWGCALYRLHRIGRIDNDQREAGDRFAKIALDYKKLVHEPITDVLGIAELGDGLSIHRTTREIGATRDMIAHAWAENLKEQTQLELKRDERTTKRYRESAAVAGQALSILEDLVLDDVWPVGERGQREIANALTRLSHFFCTGTKRKR